MRLFHAGMRYGLSQIRHVRICLGRSVTHARLMLIAHAAQMLKHAVELLRLRVLDALRLRA